MIANKFLKTRLVCCMAHMSSYPSIMSAEQIRPQDWSNNVAILRKIEGDEKFLFSFHLKSDKFGGINKQFNMCRNVDENLTEFVARVTANVEKVINGKAKKKVKLNGPECEKDLDVMFYQDDKIVSYDNFLKVRDVLFDRGVEFGIIGERFKIDVDPPQVENAKLPSTIMAGFVLYPYKLKFECASKIDSGYEWFVSDKVFQHNEANEGNKAGVEVDTKTNSKNKREVNVQHLKWLKRTDGLYFVPSSEDVNRYVKFVCYPKNGDRHGIPYELVSKATVTAGPGECPFEKRHLFTQHVLGNNEFRVMTYNLLADLYADSEFSRTVLHPQCPSYALDIDYRKQLMLKELLGYNADLICLEEVDQKIFDGDLLPVLSEKGGMDGVFERKGGQVSEGLACFWRATKFKRLDAQRIVLADTIQCDPKFIPMLKTIQSNEKLKESMLGRTTALQIVVLES